METRGCSELTRGFGDGLKEPRVESGHRAAQRDEQERNSKDNLYAASVSLQPKRFSREALSRDTGLNRG